MVNISWLHLFILIFASFRLTHLIVYDKITAFIRKPFITISEEHNENGEVSNVISIKGSGVSYWIGSLLSCYWCVGIWSSLIIVALYMYVPILFPLLVVLAIAGVAALIESHIP